MKEYSIFIKQESGSSYMLSSYSDIYSAKKAIFNMANFQEEKNKMYFVDNDFFENKYFLCGNLRYMCIKEREVTEWVKYTEKLGLGNIVESNKIIYFDNIKKNT